MSQNSFEHFTDDPVEHSRKHLKDQLFMTLVSLVRANEWTQAHAAKVMKVSAPRMSDLFQGRLELFSIDMLIELLGRAGYRMEADCAPHNADQPLVLSLKRVTT